MPTPIETVIIRTSEGTSETCLARITRSGSETVTMIPIMKLIRAMSHILPDEAILEPEANETFGIGEAMPIYLF